MLPYLTLPLALALFAQGAGAQLLDNTLSGTDSMRLRTKRVVIKENTTSASTLEVAATGEFTYVAPGGLSFAGTIDESGKKPSIAITPDSLDTSLEALLEAARPGFDVVDGSIVVDEQGLKSKIKQKEDRGAVFVTLQAKGKFSGASNEGDFTGTFKLSATLSDEPPCSICGRTLIGTEVGQRTVGGCAPEPVAGPITLEVGPYDPINADAPATLTNSLGTDLQGTVTQNGVIFEFRVNTRFGNPDLGQIQGNLESQLLGTCHYTLGFVNVGLYGLSYLGTVEGEGGGISFELTTRFGAASHFSVPRGAVETSAQLEFAD